MKLTDLCYLFLFCFIFKDLISIFNKDDSPICKFLVLYLKNEFVSIVFFSFEYDVLPMTKRINTQVRKNKRNEKAELQQKFQIQIDKI